MSQLSMRARVRPRSRSATLLRGLLALALPVVSACDDERATPIQEPEDVTPIADYFPAALGDRWAYSDGTRLGVTAREDDVAIFFGTGLTAAQRYRVGEGRVDLVSPTGEALAPYLEPVRLGHQWRYRIGDAVCEARWDEVDTELEAAGLTIRPCARLLRRCTHPAGKPFSEETVEEHREVWCAGVGRAAERQSLDPAPVLGGETIGDRAVHLVDLRVAGGPLPPEGEGVGVLLLPTDVQAACGPRFVPETLGEVEGETFEARFGGPGGLTIRTSRSALEGDHVFEESGLHVALRSDACPLERLRLLEPTLRSLIRR